MKINYYQKYNIAYIQLREKSSEVETIKISDELNIDIALDCKVYGIQLLNANEQLNSISKSVFINDSTNKKIELPIS